MSLQGLNLDTQEKLILALSSPDYSIQQKHEIKAALACCISMLESPPVAWQAPSLTAADRVNLMEFELHCINVGLKEIRDGKFVRVEARL